MDSSYLNKVIEISNNDNKRAQRILHIIGDNEWLKTEFIGSILLLILLSLESLLLFENPLFISPSIILPIVILSVLSKRIVNNIIFYMEYRRYLIENKIIKLF